MWIKTRPVLANKAGMKTDIAMDTMNSKFKQFAISDTT
nr:MAG TPA: hypothetical protein [Bacteriophage sp.]